MKIFWCHIISLCTLIRHFNTFWSISMTVFFDPGIGRIDKILVKFCPKFLDLYVSIYGIRLLFSVCWKCANEVQCFALTDLCRTSTRICSDSTDICESFWIENLTYLLSGVNLTNILWAKLRQYPCANKNFNLYFKHKYASRKTYVQKSHL